MKNKIQNRQITLGDLAVWFLLAVVITVIAVFCR